VNCPSEVTYFSSIFVKKNIFRLYVSVDNIESVKIFQSYTHFFQMLFSIFLWKRVLFYFLVKIASETRFHQEIYKLTI